MNAEIINSLTTYSVELGSIIAIIAVGLGIKYMRPFSKHRPATTQHTELLTQTVSKDFVNLTVQTAEINDSKLFFSSGAKKPKLDDNMNNGNKIKSTNKETRDIEAEMRMIAQQSEEADRLANENNNDKEEFWNEFSKVMTGNTQQNNTQKNTTQINNNTHSVWVSWSSMSSGQMQLSNEVFALQNKWGTIEAMEELKKLINDREIINSWAILSAFPIQ